eukprot:315407-Pleurochrysis_carterae.AAC.2
MRESRADADSRFAARPAAAAPQRAVTVKRVAVLIQRAEPAARRELLTEAHRSDQLHLALTREKQRVTLSRSDVPCTPLCRPFEPTVPRLAPKPTETLLLPRKVLASLRRISRLPV